MSLASTGQGDFSAGIYRGRQAPPNSVYDAVDVLVSDESLLFKRGGSSYYSNADVANFPLTQVYDVFVQAGQRTVALASNATYALNSLAPVLVGAAGSSATTSRAVGVAGTLAIATSSGVAHYGGSLKGTSLYTTGTISVTNGTKTVTGSGTSWTANADAGMMFGAAGAASAVTLGGALGVVASVDSNTQITLRDNWAGTTQSGAAYALNPIGIGSTLANAHLASVGTTQRLVITQNNRAYYTQPGNPFAVASTATDYIELPAACTIIGAQALASTCMLFTTDGIWAVENMDLSPVDDYGNVQWAQVKVNEDQILWGEPGLAAYGSQLVVPAIDDVFLMGPSGAVESLTRWNVKPLYRSYVKAGYQPGLAVVHRGHYFLPIVNGSTLIDVLVCRLDKPYLVSVRPRIWAYPWTRLSGGAACLSYAQQIGSSTRSPKLLGVANKRIADLSGILDPDTTNSQDADGSNVTATIITRDIPTQDNIQRAIVRRARLKYELTSDGVHTAPNVSLEYSSDQDAGSFTLLTERGVQQSTSTGGATSDGSSYNWWSVGKRRERIRFRIETAGAAATFVLRQLELLIRPTGRQ